MKDEFESEIHVVGVLDKVRGSCELYIDSFHLVVFVYFETFFVEFTILFRTYVVYVSSYSHRPKSFRMPPP
jgi:hypothetical protein